MYRVVFVQYPLAVKVARGFRPVSIEAAWALAETASWDFQAVLLTEVYRRTADFQVENVQAQEKIRRSQ